MSSARKSASPQARRKPRKPSKVARKNEAPFSLVHFVLCDEVRHEKSTNKAIYLGVFTRSIIVGESGTAIDRLTLVFAIARETGEIVKWADVSLDGPRGSLAEPLRIEYASPKAQKYDTLTITAQMRGVILVEGDYTASILVNDKYSFEAKFRVKVDSEMLQEIRDGHA